MAIHRAAPQASVAEVLDRVLDRGIVIDAWLRVSVVGITLIDVDAQVIVASIDTYTRQTIPERTTAFPLRPATPRTVGPTRPRRRRPVHRLHCEAGCTVVRRAQRRPGKVRCPSEPGRVCTVAPVTQAA